MKTSVIGLILAVSCLSQPPEAPKSASQVSHGACSPNISNISGKISVQCSGIDPSVINKLNKILAESPNTVRRLQELLDKKDVELSGWITNYETLRKQLAERSADDQMSQRAASLLRDGDLDGASKLLDEIIGRDELRIDQAARDYFNRGLAYELQFRPVDALINYKLAYRYRPEEFTYALAEAELALGENLYAEAEPVFLRALSDARELAKNNSQSHLSNIARRYSIWVSSTLVPIGPKRQRRCIWLLH
ncbi:MAG: hypothetical protein M3Y57_00450 [Acidobacteriota bacterium]|nr:hypothetical protein [Acidobacteriota bacterium]